MAANPSQVGAESTEVVRPLRTPDPPQQLIVGHHPPGVDRQLVEQPVLLVPELNGAAGEGDPALGVVDGQVPVDIGFQRLELVVARPPPQAALTLATSSVGEKGLTM